MYLVIMSNIYNNSIPLMRTFMKLAIAAITTASSLSVHESLVLSDQIDSDRMPTSTMLMQMEAQLNQKSALFEVI